MRILLALFLFACSSAYGQEFALLSGKGVMHNPNADDTSLTLRTTERGTGSLKTYTEFGIASINTSLDREFGRAFTMVSAAKQIEYTAGVFYANISLGAALAQRTSDGSELAVAPYGSAFVGIRYRGISAGFGQWIVYQPHLTYRWTAGEGAAYHEAGERWNSPVFTGFRLGINLDVKRSTHD